MLAAMPHRTYLNLGISQLTRLALTSQDTGIVAAAVKELKGRSNLSPEILEFADAHLTALTTRDKAMEMLRHYHELVPKLEQRIQELEGKT
jgi:hypothetical protein